MNKKLALVLLSFSVLIGGCNTSEPIASADENTKKNKSENIEVTTKEEKTSAFETVPDGFRVITVGSGNPKTEVGRNAPSTLVQFKDKYFLVDSGGQCHKYPFKDWPACRKNYEYAVHPSACRP